MEGLGSLADEFLNVENIKGKNKSKLDVYRKNVTAKADKGQLLRHCNKMAHTIKQPAHRQDATNIATFLESFFFYIYIYNKIKKTSADNITKEIFQKLLVCVECSPCTRHLAEISVDVDDGIQDDGLGHDLVDVRPLAGVKM